MAGVLIPYTGVDKPGTDERVPKVFEGAGPGVGIHGRKTVSGAVEGGNIVTSALEEILINNGNTGGLGLEGLLVSALGLNPAQIAAVKEMGTKNQ